jgi:inorganic pyrophosphatase
MADVSYGDDAPNVVNVVIEMPRGHKRNKYEMDKDTGKLFLDRVNATTLSYPADYGFVPNTLCEDGDPLDALVVIDEPLHPDVVVPVRPIGVFYMVDEGEGDEKIICVAAKDISKDHIKNVDDLGETFKNTVVHYFEHGKDWKNDWRGVPFENKGWGDAEAAKKVIQESIARAK